MMRDYTMDLTKIAASIVTDCLGAGLTSNTYYSADGNSIIMEFNGYPLRNSNRSGKVYVQFPRSTFYVRKGDVHYTPIQQAQCRYSRKAWVISLHIRMCTMMAILVGITVRERDR